jgi:hypothetical protein
MEDDVAKWKNCNLCGVTWGFQLSGDEIVERLQSQKLLKKKSRIVEVGPGYCRLLRSLIKRRIPIRQYLAVDVSKQACDLVQQIGHRRRLGQRVKAICEDARTVSLPFAPTLVISSLTLHHLYPTFESVLQNLTPQMAERAHMVFDVPVGDCPRSHWPQDQDDPPHFWKKYSNEEVVTILKNVNLTIVSRQPVDWLYYNRVEFTVLKA